MMLRTAFVLVCTAVVGQGRRFQRRGSEAQELRSLFSNPGAAFNPSMSASASAGRGRWNQMDRRIPDSRMRARLSEQAATESLSSRGDVSRRKMIGALLGVFAAAAAPRSTNAALESQQWKRPNDELVQAKLAAIYVPPTPEEVKAEEERQRALQARYERQDRIMKENEIKSGIKPQYCAGMQAANQPMYVNMCDIIGDTKADRANSAIDTFGNAIVGENEAKAMIAKLEKEDPELTKRVKKMMDRATKITGY